MELTKRKRENIMYKTYLTTVTNTSVTRAIANHDFITSIFIGSDTQRNKRLGTHKSSVLAITGELTNADGERFPLIVQQTVKIPNVVHENFTNDEIRDAIIAIQPGILSQTAEQIVNGHIDANFKNSLENSVILGTTSSATLRDAAVADEKYPEFQ